MATIVVDREPNQKEVMETIWVALGVNPDTGKEGIVSEYRVGVGMMPMVEVNESGLSQLFAAAQKASAKTGRVIRVVKYTNRKLLKTFPETN